MWWGKGDTSRLEEPEQTTLAHLRRLEETGHVVTLNAEKAEVAARAVDFFGSWESFFRLATSLRNVALLIGGLLAIYWATEGAAITFIQQAIGGGE